MPQQNQLVRAPFSLPSADRELPPGAQLLIAIPLGIIAWWFIVRAVLWLAA